MTCASTRRNSIVNSVRNSTSQLKRIRPRVLCVNAVRGPMFGGFSKNRVHAMRACRRANERRYIQTANLRHTPCQSEVSLAYDTWNRGVSRKLDPRRGSVGKRHVLCRKPTEWCPGADRLGRQSCVSYPWRHLEFHLDCWHDPAHVAYRIVLQGVTACLPFAVNSVII